jgi:hypothetical protein
MDTVSEEFSGVLPINTKRNTIRSSQIKVKTRYLKRALTQGMFRGSRSVGYYFVRFNDLCDGFELCIVLCCSSLLSLFSAPGAPSGWLGVLRWRMAEFSKVRVTCQL